MLSGWEGACEGCCSGMPKMGELDGGRVGEPIMAGEVDVPVEAGADVVVVIGADDGGK